MKPPRKLDIEGDCAVVPLTRGYKAIIDASDASLVEGYSWCAIVVRRNDGSPRNIYACRRALTSPGQYRIVLMHRLINGTPDGLDTDHIDGDGLNNRRANLRTATRSQNVSNGRFRPNNTSGYKGVFWCKRAKKWQAQITINGRRKSLGMHETAEMAAAAYEKASRELHGIFSRIA